VYFEKSGEKIKQYRKILKVSQKEAAGSKMSHSMISLIEGGKTHLTTVTAIMIADNLNKIAANKGIELNLSLKDFYTSERSDTLESLMGKADSSKKSEDNIDIPKELEGKVKLETLLDLGYEALEGKSFQNSLAYFELALENSLIEEEHEYIIKSYKGIYEVFKVRETKENFEKYIGKILELFINGEDCKLKLPYMVLALKYYSDISDYEKIRSIINLSENCIKI
jgi:transcriptional regulator with XRE-family HTH domain